MKKQIKQALVEGFVCTDDHTNQYGRSLGNLRFEFFQDDIDRTIIDLKEYTNTEIEVCINTFGYTLYTRNGLTNIEELYKNDADWIKAECLFEMCEEPQTYKINLVD